ncbi:histidine utilization repressor [Martelella endophytica]|uniref:Histidine utilization repressor n=1 Tax=Martelella endophytica TaxID=1486262 RepID=A0A0D5LK30_MAREN|nr:histidine utilization repressor [Martelella endophytica]AJY44491.1 GntR family transcriptional regulator [Martelella endophytica]
MAEGKESRPLALHARIEREVEDRILSGEWPPGTRIPFEHELTAHYGCSRMTVNKALSELVRKGLIERRRKSGSYVRQPEVLSAVMEIHQLEREVRALGLAYDFRPIESAIRSADAADRRRLMLERPEELLHLRSLHVAGSRPFCLEDRLINLAEVPQARQTDFSKSPPGTWLLEQVPWSAAEHRINATAAGRAEAELLDLREGTPCLVVARRTWNTTGSITQVNLTYPGDMHTLVAQFAPSGRPG